MKIIYKNLDGSVAVIHPTPEAMSLFTINEIALKDVPTGLAFSIVEDSEIPTDRTFRDAWEVDPVTLSDGIGADYGAGSENILIGFDEHRNPMIMTHQEYAEQQGMSL